MAATERKVEPEIEEIVKKIKILIEEKQVSDVELKKLQARQSAMEKDLDELNHEIFCLETTCNKKEVGQGTVPSTGADPHDQGRILTNVLYNFNTTSQLCVEVAQGIATLKRLQFQYEQGQAQTERQLKGSSESKQRIQALTSQIQDEKLQRRKERKAFEQQLEELIKKHKWTAEFYTPPRLQLEMRKIENSMQQLLSEEHVAREKLNTLDKELNSLQQHGAAGDEVIFLHSKGARLTHQLFEEENRAVKAALREMTQQRSKLQQEPELGRLEGEEWEPKRKIPAARKDTALRGEEGGNPQQPTK